MGWHDNGGSFWALTEEGDSACQSLYEIASSDYHAKLLLAASPTDRIVAVSGDGRWIALQRQAGQGTHTLLLIDTQQPSMPQPLVQRQTYTGRQVVAFSPDGRFLYYTSAKDSEFEQLHRIALHTRIQQTVLPQQADITFLRWSPRGRFYAVGVSHGESVRVMIIETNTDRTILQPQLPGGVVRVEPEAANLLRTEKWTAVQEIEQRNNVCIDITPESSFSPGQDDFTFETDPDAVPIQPAAPNFGPAIIPEELRAELEAAEAEEEAERRALEEKEVVERTKRRRNRRRGRKRRDERPARGRSTAGNAAFDLPSFEMVVVSELNLGDKPERAAAAPKSARRRRRRRPPRSCGHRQSQASLGQAGTRSETRDSRAPRGVAEKVFRLICRSPWKRFTQVASSCITG